MGCSAFGSCPCGYQSPLLMVGGGMADFEYNCAFPAFCSGGSHLVTVNMFNEPLRCPDGHSSRPLPYNDGALVNKVGDHVVAEWNVGDRQLQLTDGHYLCPACRKFTLTFSQGEVLWD